MNLVTKILARIYTHRQLTQCLQTNKNYAVIFLIFLPYQLPNLKNILNKTGFNSVSIVETLARGVFFCKSECVKKVNHHEFTIRHFKVRQFWRTLQRNINIWANQGLETTCLDFVSENECETFLRGYITTERLIREWR